MASTSKAIRTSEEKARAGSSDWTRSSDSFGLGVKHLDAFRETGVQLVRTVRLEQTVGRNTDDHSGDNRNRGCEEHGNDHR